MWAIVVEASVEEFGPVITGGSSAVADKDITFDELQKAITVSTQQLAKRQITWTNKFKIDYQFSYPNNNYHSLFNYIKKILN